MRRQFRRDLLITEVPPKPQMRWRRKKNPNLTCEALRLLMRGYISKAGAQNVDRNAWALFCGVHVKTLNKWIAGYPMREDLIYRVARYLAPLLDSTKKQVAEEICKTLREWRAA